MCHGVLRFANSTLAKQATLHQHVERVLAKQRLSHNPEVTTCSQHCVGNVGDVCCIAPKHLYDQHCRACCPCLRHTSRVRLLLWLLANGSLNCWKGSAPPAGCRPRPATATQTRCILLTWLQSRGQTVIHDATQCIRMCYLEWSKWVVQQAALIE